MNSFRFFKYLAMLVICMLLFSHFIHQRKNLIEYKDFSLFGILVFTLICILFYFLADYFSRHSNDKAFMTLIFINFFVKLVAVLALPVAYFNISKPSSGVFVLPFIVIYVCFTIFETYFLNSKAVMRK